jgi:hypothetical protein
MDVFRAHRACGVLTLVAALGCGRETAVPPGTGAREAAQGFFEALSRQEWAQAYAGLDAGTRRRWGPEQFARLAASYRRNLGFEPTSVHVRACEEQGKEATAHVVLEGRAASPQRPYKDAVMLREDDGVWRVVLPVNFGQVRGRR